MRKTALALAALLALTACGAEKQDPSTSSDATVRLPAVPGRPAAGYFRLRVEGDNGALVSVSSPQAGRIEMHETMTDGNMSSMRSIPRIPVRDGETIAFEPGGRHLMLYDLAPSLRPGDTMNLTLRFERGAEQQVAAAVAAAGGDAHPGH